MSYILIPTSKKYINNIEFLLKTCDSNTDTIFISDTLYIYLNKIKEKINDFTKEWDFYKKITNPYEYIHTHILYKHFSVSKYKPI